MLKSLHWSLGPKVARVFATKSTKILRIYLYHRVVTTIGFVASPLLTGFYFSFYSRLATLPTAMVI